NSRGVDLSDVLQLQTLSTGMQEADAKSWQAGPLVNGNTRTDEPEPIHSPAHNSQVVGQITWSNADDIENALTAAAAAAPRWDATPAAERAACLRRYADLLEQNMATMVALCA